MVQKHWTVVIIQAWLSRMQFQQCFVPMRLLPVSLVDIKTLVSLSFFTAGTTTDVRDTPSISTYTKYNTITIIFTCIALLDHRTFVWLTSPLCKCGVDRLSHSTPWLCPCLWLQQLQSWDRSPAERRTMSSTHLAHLHRNNDRNAHRKPGYRYLHVSVFALTLLINKLCRKTHNVSHGQPLGFSRVNDMLDRYCEEICESGLLRVPNPQQSQTHIHRPHRQRAVTRTLTDLHQIIPAHMRQIMNTHRSKQRERERKRSTCTDFSQLL